MTPNQISVSNIGQIKNADVKFGDLTVFVGPQATGKSIFLQLLKLVVDAPSIQAEFKKFGIDWEGKLGNLLELYFGEGMSGIWQDGVSQLKVDGKDTSLEAYAKGLKRKEKDERLFFIPAQRVMSLRDGLTQPFSVYRSGDPFVLREFSEKLHQLVQNEFGRNPELFPQANRLKKAERDLLSEHIFGGFDLKTSSEKLQKQFVLNRPGQKKGLPYLVWSAGQREFVPLLLGLYWLMPPSAVAKRNKLEWVVIEEMEMGLHPNAISAVLLLVLDLLSRGYRVCLSTHSPHVLDLVWALQLMKERKGTIKDVLSIFNIKSDASTKSLADAGLEKEMNVYHFGRDGEVRDISNLDPGAENEIESGWGGLTEFSGRVGQIVAQVANRFESQQEKQTKTKKVIRLVNEPEGDE
jgi:energy-coupling factor transporter ATP-binding protein EcfA2